MKNSAIAWTDHTFNPWEGCTKVSPGCAHCYAEARNRRFLGGVNWGPGAPRRRTAATNWKQPLGWNHAAEWNERDAEACDRAVPVRPRVFCASLADWLDDEVPIEWLRDLLALIAQCGALDWLLLTKRPGAWESRLAQVAEMELAGLPALGVLLAERWLKGHAPSNVWLGTTTEDQQRANERIPVLVSIPARVRFLSCEPLLEAVDLSPWLSDAASERVHWVIVGGESGSGARTFDLNWARSLRVQCHEAGVAFFMKQLGAHACCSPEHDGATGYEIKTKDRAGAEPEEWPADLRIQQFPAKIITAEKQNQP